MTCGACKRSWHVAAEPPAAPVECPNCEAHVCACGCGSLLGEMKSTARYKSPACRTALERAGWGTTRAAKAHVAQTGGEVRPLSVVASDGDLAERFRPLIRTAIVDRLKTTGVCHADDLADVYPEGHVDLCRHLATAHFGQLARRKLIEKTEWRKSTAPGRNGGGSWVWKFTKAGWDKYGTAGVHTDAIAPGGPGRSGVDSGEAPSEGAPSAAPSPAPVEPARLFADETPRPLNPLSDSEAA